VFWHERETWISRVVERDLHGISMEALTTAQSGAMAEADKSTARGAPVH
jgi:hypothetical protein